MATALVLVNGTKVNFKLFEISHTGIKKSRSRLTHNIINFASLEFSNSQVTV